MPRPPRPAGATAPRRSGRRPRRSTARSHDDWVPPEKAKRTHQAPPPTKVVAAPPPVRCGPKPSQPTLGRMNKRLQRAAVVGAAAIAALVAWTFIHVVSGVDLAVRTGTSVTHVGAIAVAFTAILAGLAGWA